MKTNKKFDCVEMMHQGAERIRRETDGMTIEQEVAYWKKRTAELRKLKRGAKGSDKVS
jgi:hypothetical protein